MQYSNNNVLNCIESELLALQAACLYQLCRSNSGHKDEIFLMELHCVFFHLLALIEHFFG